MSNRPNTKKARRSPTPAAKPTTWWQSPLVWVGGLVIVAAAVALGVAASSGEVTPTAETAFTEALGTPLEPFATPDPAIGMQAPLISAQTMDGERVQLKGDGTARLFGFFAHWCPHCQAELPVTARWLKENSVPDGVEVVAVSTSVDAAADNYPPSEWFEREEWPATVLLDGEASTIASAYGLTAFPFWVAVDADGLVVARVSGALEESSLASLLAELAPQK